MAVRSWSYFQKRPPTEDKESGSLHTPTAKAKQLAPSMNSGWWPTPRAADVEGGIVQNVDYENGKFSRKNKEGVRWGVKLRDAVNHAEKMWPTPIAGDAHLSSTEEVATKRIKEGKITLSRAVQSKMWPTPMARDYKDTPNQTDRGQGSRDDGKLPVQVYRKEKDQDNQDKLRGHLSADWVELLMGYPLGWTQIGNEESQE